ncbi:MAG TPA: sigma 54-interacting transcriptional regulator [Kofleriaceae bacterium]
MGQDTTITSVSRGRSDAEAAPDARPQLVLIAISDQPQAASSRHLLDDVDEVRFGRGERSAQRLGEDGRRVLELRIPDRRMSSQHGRMLRGPSGWVLDDPESKNGAVVDGVVTRRIVIGDDVVIELGHTFFLFRNMPVERNAASDVADGGLAGGSAVLETYDGPLADQFATLGRIAATEVSVLLQGETGTGKELVARALHQLSRRSGAFVAVNCGALPANLVEAELFGHRRGAFTGAVGERLGLVRSADAGTLFLDEVGELPATSQAAFLRVLQEREVVPVGVDHPVKVDVRLCAATLRDLEALVAAGQFRRDLYGRLFGLTIELPPLRRRRVDLGLLARRLLARTAEGAQVRFSPAALRAMLRHDWPLNIRELEKVLATAVALATEGVIEAAHLPELQRRAPRGDAGPPVAPAEQTPPAVVRSSDDELREQLVGLLTVHNGNVLAVSRALRTRRTQVYRWLQRFGIQVDAFRRRAGS